MNPSRMVFNESPAEIKTLATTIPIIDVGLVKTHARCLPCDLRFTTYQLENVVFHFPIPPSSKKSTAKHSPADSAVHIGSVDDGPRASAGVDQEQRERIHVHCKTRINSARIDIPIRTSSLQPIDQPPPPSEESCQTVNGRTYHDNFQQQETLHKLEAENRFDLHAPQSTSTDTKHQRADMPQQRDRTAKVGPPPSRPAPQRPLREEINPDFRRASDVLRRRAASLRTHHHEQQSARPRGKNKAQLVLGLERPEKSAVEQLFDQAVLEFQLQSPRVAEKISHRNEIGAHRWAARTQRQILMNEQTFYTPGSTWRPTAKVHRTVASGSSNITISTPALANRLGVAVGASAQLRLDAFYNDD